MLTLTQMNRDPWSILDELESLQDDMNRVFGSGLNNESTRRGRTAYPPVNIWRAEDQITVDAELPGADEKNIAVAVEADQLTISGEINTLEHGEGVQCHRRERVGGKFSRTLSLPFRAESDKIKASYKNGILRISIPCPEAEKPHKVKVEVN